MVKASGKVVCQLIHHYRHDAFFPRESVDFALNYKPENTDKFLVTYPKCGTTWTQQIICLIINNGLLQKNDREFISNSFIEYKGKKSLDITIKPRVIKTHLPFNLMPYNKSAKYLYVLRNPKDTCVSYYYHTKDMPTYQFDGDFHEYFNCWIKGEIPYGDYFEHTLTFWSHRFDDNFTFLIYEEMKNNLREAVLKIGQFLGEEFVVKLKENNELVLNRVIENSTIDAMKGSLKQEYKNQFALRKGMVGDWRNHFTKEESDLVDEKVKKMFSGTGLEKLWAEDMKWSIN
jgi:hypothetical protein